MLVALIGNQNCGKTTLFNRLTGSRLHVGNFPGVTVEKKVGIMKGHKGDWIVDLPGIYALSPYSSEERITIDFLLEERPDLIINILDVNNLERNLYLTLQLLDLEIPMVLAFNMIDEFEHNGGKIDFDALRQCLGLPIVLISATSNRGIKELKEEVYLHAKVPKKIKIYDKVLDQTLSKMIQRIETSAKWAQIPPAFAACQLMENNVDVIKKLALSRDEQAFIEKMMSEMEKKTTFDRFESLAMARYNFIDDLLKQCVIEQGVNRAQRLSLKMDQVLTHRYFGIPIFILSLLGIFFLSFEVIGKVLSEGVLLALEQFSAFLASQLELNFLVSSLLIEGILQGLGSVLSFLPIVMTLFFFLSIIEDSGYMARIAFMMDRPLRVLGLSGRSFVPLLMGLGCSVPAIMATRTLTNQREQRRTIFLVPFVSCSAKLPVYAMFTYAFFRERAIFVILILYLLGISLGLIVSSLDKTLEPSSFLMELPNYRWPSLRTVCLLVKEKAEDFIKKVFTVIFVASLIIWFLKTFDASFHVALDSKNSLLAMFSQLLTPFFKPLGFTSWQAIAALLSGICAKEAIISTLTLLTEASLQSLFTPLSAFSFLVFTLLYTPCAATLASVGKETENKKWAILMLLKQTALAWIIAMLVYQFGCLLL